MITDGDLKWGTEDIGPDEASIPTLRINGDIKEKFSEALDTVDPNTPGFWVNFAEYGAVYINVHEKTIHLPTEAFKNPNLRADIDQLTADRG